MSRSRIPAQPRRPVDRIPALPINAAARVAALAEFQRAERSVDALMAIVARYRHALSALRRTFTLHRQRHG